MTFVRDSQGPAALSVYSFEAAAADQSTAAERSCSSSVRLPVSFIYFTCSEVQFLRCANKKIVFYKVTSFCFCQNLQRAFLQLNSGYNCHQKCDVFRFPCLIYVNITFRNSTDKIDIRDVFKNCYQISFTPIPSVTVWRQNHTCCELPSDWLHHSSDGKTAWI